MITLQNVSKTYQTPEGAVSAISSVSLQIDQGDIFGIIGFSGAGKSTLLRTMNLLEVPDPGSSVIVNGRELTGLGKSELNSERLSIGFVFQHFHLLNNRTVADNVSFPLEIAGKSKAERKKRVAECLEIVGLTQKAGAYPAKLSGGQKQRVAIARALANRPRVLLCDEPTSSVDPQMTGTILAFLERINQQFGITIVLVTHEISAVNAICNRVAVMEAGQIAEVISFEELPYKPKTDISRLLLQRRGLAATRFSDFLPAI